MDPVRDLRLPVAWQCAPRRALRLSLDAPPRCFESASTTDVSLTSTRRENTLFGDCPPSAVGRPAGVPLRDPLRARCRHRRSGKTPDHLAVIRPPTAPCLTARRRLRDDRLPRPLSRGAESTSRCFQPRDASPIEPSDASMTIEERSARALPFPSPISLPRAARQCRPPPRDRGAFRRESPDRAPSRAPAWSSAPAGRRALALHVFIDVRKLRLDPSPRRFRGRFGPRALPRLLQIDVSTSTASDRSNIPGRRNPWPGRLPVRSIVASRSRTTAEGTQGQGPRVTEPSALPPGIAPARDFAPTPIASGTSCRGHCPSPGLESRGR
jgi:hypothetical protein